MYNLASLSTHGEARSKIQHLRKAAPLHETTGLQWLAVGIQGLCWFSEVFAMNGAQNGTRFVLHRGF